MAVMAGWVGCDVSGGGGERAWLSDDGESEKARESVLRCARSKDGKRAELTMEACVREDECRREGLRLSRGCEWCDVTREVDVMDVAR